MNENAKSILLVEPVAELARLTARVLRPHRVLVAGSLRQADEILRRVDIDVVVFDPRAPGEPGIDFLLELARERPSVRIVVYTRSAAAEKSGAFGLAHATLLKPSSDARLRAAILGDDDTREFRHPRRSP